MKNKKLGEAVAVCAAVLNGTWNTAEENQSERESEDCEHYETKQAAHICLAGNNTHSTTPAWRSWLHVDDNIATNRILNTNSSHDLIHSVGLRESRLSDLWRLIVDWRLSTVVLRIV